MAILRSTFLGVFLFLITPAWSHDGFVSVKDFPRLSGETDDTGSFERAQNASPCIQVPPGTYVLTDFIIKSRKRFDCAGYGATTIIQGNPNKPAIHVNANIDRSETDAGHIYDSSITGFTLKGAIGATKNGPGVLLETIETRVIRNFTLDFKATGCFNSLQMVCPAGQINGCKIRVIQEDSLETGVITKGSYNLYDLFIGQSKNGIAILDGSWGGHFIRAISDGAQQYCGQNCLIENPTVEAWTGSAQEAAISNPGYSNRLIGVAITNVPNSKANIGLALNAGGGNRTTIIGLRILGKYPETAPAYPISIPTGNSGSITDVESGCLYVLGDYIPASVLAAFSFHGDCSSLLVKR